MAAADLTAWRKLNSDPMTVDIILSEGSTMRAIVMIPREKSLKDVFNVADTFIEVECVENGPIVFQREALRSVRPALLPRAVQLDKRVAAAEKMQAHQALKVAKMADRATIEAAHAKLKAEYDPARALAADMPAEVVAFMETMCRRFDAARAELDGILDLAQAPAA
jgi:hypothetical protein